ncbi:hypothetical protein ACLIR7_07265 [Nitratireductor aquimarinus]|uniref:hypothetical protein n=1 Tax=Nitratireductor aquimarinus TaxID=889300 RepID=UPI00398F6867
MALSPAEKQRRFRERQREKAKASPDQTKAVTVRPFSEFIGNRTLMLDENLDAFGIQISGNFLSEEIQTFDSEKQHDEPMTALERATGLVGVFIDAAKELSELINEYKIEEIDQQMASAPAAKRIQLETLRKRLSKRTSHFFPVIEVKGD